ncbi:MAG: hydroxypyruvate isomerase family protein [Bacteroidota bacterium]
MTTRRRAIKTILAGAAAVASNPEIGLAMTEKHAPVVRKGNIRHSVCRWCYSGFSLDQLCVFAKQIGISAIDLIGPDEWHILKSHGLDSSMCNGAEISLVAGWNNPKFHDQLIKNYSDMIPRVAKAGYKNLIFFSGNRQGMDDETGLKNSVEGLKKIVGLAEKNGVILQLEVFNSKVDHKDYMADNTPWAIELCKQVGSENVKILYDIYHMQISEGDIIRTIRDHHQWFGHYHTAGVPGRNEIDDTQELNYPAIMRAIAETGFKGYVAQEFIPRSGDPLGSLAASIDLCDI